MKIKVEYSESIQVAEGLWRKIGIEMEDEREFCTTNVVDPMHHIAKEYVQRWHREAQPQTSSDLSFPRSVGGLSNYVTPSQPSVIDRSIERLEIMIDDCKTVEELREVYEKNHKKIYENATLTDVYAKKLESLTN